MTLKLFVWEDMRGDYPCGLAVAMAHDVDGAREVLLRTTGKCPGWLIQEIDREPNRTYDVPAGAFCWGVAAGAGDLTQNRKRGIIGAREKNGQGCP